MDYVYAIGKYEVTARQYAGFLPALSAPGLLVMLLWIAVIGTIVLRPRRRSSGG